MEKSSPVLYIVGPTAAGKTSYAEHLATLIPAEIINMDIGQLYRPLSIGTAKPLLASYTVPHHLFDIFEQPQSLTVVAYAKMLQAIVPRVHERGNCAMVVGGSAFYLTSLFFPPQSTGTPGNMVTQDYEMTSTLWDQLNMIDPERACAIAPTDVYRLKRALALWHATGKPPSMYKPQFSPLFADTHIILVIRDRDDLYQRINSRVQSMLHAGWLDEIESIKGTEWELFVREKNIIGYPELLDYVHGIDHRPLSEIIEVISQKTRQYAKRQVIFFRRLQRLLAQEQYLNSTVLNLTHDDPQRYNENLIKHILG